MEAIHFNDAMQVLDIAREYRQKVSLHVWEGKTGEIVYYDSWLVSSSNWKGGWHRIVNPKNNQIRTVPDIFIIKINEQPIYL